MDGGQTLRRGLFHAVLVTATGLAVTVMAGLLLSQVAYAGLKKPLASLLRPEVLHALFLSCILATAAALIALALAIPSAYLLARRVFPGRLLVDTLLDLPVVLSPLAVGFSLLLFFRTAPGSFIENHVLRFVFEPAGIVLAQAILAYAVAVRVLKTAFEEVEPRYEQVARLMGCTPFMAFRKVTLPMARPGVVAAAVLGWGRAVGDFGATVMVGGAVAGRTETVPVAIYLRLASVDIAQAVGLMLVLTAAALAVLLLVRITGRAA